MEIIAILFKILIYLFIIGVGSLFYALYNKKVTNEQVKSLVQSTVKFVEQVYGSETGQAKFKQAYHRVAALLASKNIKINEDELQILIEEAVIDCKELFQMKKEIEAENELNTIKGFIGGEK